MAPSNEMGSVPWPRLADTPPLTARVEIPTPGENFVVGAPQGTGDVGGGPGVEQQGTGDELSRVDEGSVHVGHALSVAAEAHVEATGRDEPRPFEPEGVAEAAALLLEPALR